jgi:hypothetical protein
MATTRHTSWMASALAGASVLACFLLSPIAFADELPSDWIDDFESNDIPHEEWMDQGAMPDFVATVKVLLPAAEGGSSSARVYLAYLMGLIDAAEKLDHANDGYEPGMFEKQIQQLVGRSLAEIKSLSRSWEKPIVLGDNRTEAKLMAAAVSQREGVTKWCWVKLYYCFDDGGKDHSLCKKEAAHLLETKKC